MKKRPFILTIAGFDPSGGAGLNADIKTMEALKCYGLSVCSANTVQNDISFLSCHWTELNIMKEQIDVLFNRFSVDYVKIGIVENWKILLDLVQYLKSKNNRIKIILDPVLSASANFDFHNKDFRKEFDDVLDSIYLLTPNYIEIEKLYPNLNQKEAAKLLAERTNVLLKGGHREEAIGKDVLYTTQGKHFVLNPKIKNISEKHGSGCVLSSSITSYLALGFPLLKACYRGKRYTEKFLSSNISLLGTHSSK